MGDFEGLGEPIIHLVLSKLDSEDIARVSCVNSFLHVCASDDSLWSLHCSADLNLSTPLDLLSSPLPSFRVAYLVWRNAFSMYPWLLVKRVYKCWDKLKSWLEIKFPEVADTLRSGVTEDELNEFEKCMGVKLPMPSRVLYRICDGQEPQANKLWGLIGGYAFLHCFANVYLLSLREICKRTESYRHLMDFPLSPKYIVVAVSPLSGKVFFLNCTSGQLYVGTMNLIEDGDMLPCVPSEMLRLINRSDNGEIQQDGLLLWLEEHARRLQNGIIRIQIQGKSKWIHQFPERFPMPPTSVTNGVQVRAFTVIIPEMSYCEGYESAYSISHSIRMSLSPEGCTVHGMRHNSCQLSQGHWVIRENDTVVLHNYEETYVEQAPLVTGRKQAEYLNWCFSGICGRSSLEGSLTFVPGSLSAPKGDPFNVGVGPFLLELPEYIF